MHPLMWEADSLHLSLDRLCYYDLEADSPHLSLDRLCYYDLESDSINFELIFCPPD